MRACARAPVPDPATARSSDAPGPAGRVFDGGCREGPRGRRRGPRGRRAGRARRLRRGVVGVAGELGALSHGGRRCAAEEAAPARSSRPSRVGVPPPVAGSTAVADVPVVTAVPAPSAGARGAGGDDRDARQEDGFDPVVVGPDDHGLRDRDRVVGLERRARALTERGGARAAGQDRRDRALVGEVGVRHGLGVEHELDALPGVAERVARGHRVEGLREEPVDPQRLARVLEQLRLRDVAVEVGQQVEVAGQVGLPAQRAGSWSSTASAGPSASRPSTSPRMSPSSAAASARSVITCPRMARFSASEALTIRLAANSRS